MGSSDSLKTPKGTSTNPSSTTSSNDNRMSQSPVTENKSRNILYNMQGNLISNTFNPNSTITSRKSKDFCVKFQDQGFKFYHIQLWLDGVMEARNSAEGNDLEPAVKNIEDSELNTNKKGKTVWKKILDKG